MNEQTKIELGEFKWLFESPFCRINKQTQTHTHTNIPTMRNRRPDRNPFPTSCVLIIFICLSRPLRDTHISIVHNSYRVNDDGFSFTKWKKKPTPAQFNLVFHMKHNTQKQHTPAIEMACSRSIRLSLHVAIFHPSMHALFNWTMLLTGYRIPFFFFMFYAAKYKSKVQSKGPVK